MPPAWLSVVTFSPRPAMPHALKAPSLSIVVRMSRPRSSGVSSSAKRRPAGSTSPWSASPKLLPAQRAAIHGWRSPAAFTTGPASTPGFDQSQVALPSTSPSAALVPPCRRCRPIKERRSSASTLTSTPRKGAPMKSKLRISTRPRVRLVSAPQCPWTSMKA